MCNYESRTYIYIFYNVLYDGLPNQIAHSKREYQKLMINTTFICHDWNQWINQCNQSIMKETFKNSVEQKKTASITQLET